MVWTAYSGYFYDAPSFFATATILKSGLTTDFGAVNTATGNNYMPDLFNSISIQWLGYFRATETGTWTFFTESDDASYVWLGTRAVSGFAASNAVVNNGGGHGMIIKSGQIDLLAGEVYYLRIQYGQGGGGANMRLSFAPPSGGQYFDMRGYCFIGSPGINDVSLQTIASGFLEVRSGFNGTSSTVSTLDLQTSNMLNNTGKLTWSFQFAKWNSAVVRIYWNEVLVLKTPEFAVAPTIGSGGVGTFGTDIGDVGPLRLMPSGQTLMRFTSEGLFRWSRSMNITARQTVNQLVASC